MTEPRSDFIHYHPEIEIRFGQDFVMHAQLESEGDKEPEDQALVVEVQPFILIGIGRGRLKLLEVGPDDQDVRSADRLIFPAGATLPMRFSIYIDDLTYPYPEGILAHMRFRDQLYSCIPSYDLRGTGDEGPSRLRFWDWEDEEGLCQPIYPPIQEILSEITFSFTRSINR